LSTTDGPLIFPGFDEKSDKPESIAGELTGKQIAWLYVPGQVTIIDENNKPVDHRIYSVGAPDLWDSFAIETSDAGRMIIFAAPVQSTDPLAKGGPNQPALRTVILWRWVQPPQVLWGTKQQAQHLRGFTNEPVIHSIQEWVHGLIVRDVQIKQEPNRMGGQDAAFILSEGVTLNVRTRRRAQHIDPNTGESAAFELGLIKPGIIRPGTL
jgi:hypothetical protein